MDAVLTQKEFESYIEDYRKGKESGCKCFCFEARMLLQKDGSGGGRICISVEGEV